MNERTGNSAEQLARSKLAVGYVRCSTEMQEDSPEQQKREILEFARKNGFDLIDWFVDFGKSGTTFDQRESFQALRKSVENGHTFGTVICYDESRWGRAIDSEENTYWRFHFRKFGVNVILVKTSIDPEHEFAPMLKAFEGVQASQYSKKLSELTLRGAMNNDVYSSGGTAPYGYCRMARNTKTGSVKRLGDGEWCVKKQEKVFWSLGDDSEVQTVRCIFEERGKGVSYITIAKSLNDKSVPCARRGRWRNLDSKWSATTIKSIIENPAYYGARAYNKMSSSKILALKKKRPMRPGAKWPMWRNPQEEWRVVENAHEGIVSKQLWQDANSADARRAQAKPNQHSYHSCYLLTGLIHCSKCGFAFQGWSGKANGKRYLRYIDGGWQSKRVCSFLSIPKERLEDFALQSIRDTIREPEMVMRIETQVQELQRKFSLQPEQVRQSHTKALADNRTRFDNLIRLAEEGAVQIEVIKTRLNELEEERARLEKLLARTDSSPVRLDIDEIKQEVAKFVLNFEERFEAAPIEEKKELVQRCISRIVVDRERMVVRFYVKRIPAVLPQMEALFETKPAGFIVSERCARNRT
jgi:site-specific DNA recombinase